MEVLVNPYWSELNNMVYLAKSLQTRSSKELTHNTCEAICKRLKIKHDESMEIFLGGWIQVAKQFIRDVYKIVEKDIREHAYNYPMDIWPVRTYNSFRGRILHENVLNILRSVSFFRKRLEPGKITDPVPKIILPGVDYSAESLVFNDFLKNRQLALDKKRLEWMHKDARADYAIGVVCFGSEDFETLTKAWFLGEVDSVHDYIEALDTLIEEALHGMADQIAKTPRYGRGAERKEHYWMNEYGDFPEKIYNAILAVANKYVGCLKNVGK